jgi:hypothetical protein
MKMLLFFLSGLGSLTFGFSQGVKKDSSTDMQLKNVTGLYNKYTAGNAPVYNGTDYLYFTFQMEGDPFFEIGDLSNGWLSYKGIVYDPLSVKYDLARNQVVILPLHGASGIVLDNEFIDSFMAAKHTFIHLNEDHQQNIYNTGFYDVLCNGHVQLLAKRTKTMSENLGFSTVTIVFSSKDHFYIHKNGVYYLVSKQKDVFRLLNDKKHELRKAMHQQHVKFLRKNLESTLINVTAIYNQLIH